jgi:hypothetical protein
MQLQPSYHGSWGPSSFMLVSQLLCQRWSESMAAYCSIMEGDGVQGHFSLLHVRRIFYNLTFGGKWSTKACILGIPWLEPSPCTRMV